MSVCQWVNPISIISIKFLFQSDDVLPPNGHSARDHSQSPPVYYSLNGTPDHKPIPHPLHHMGHSVDYSKASHPLANMGHSLDYKPTHTHSLHHMGHSMDEATMGQMFNSNNTCTYEENGKRNICLKYLNIEISFPVLSIVIKIAEDTLDIIYMYISFRLFRCKLNVLHTFVVCFYHTMSIHMYIYTTYIHVFMNIWIIASLHDIFTEMTHVNCPIIH